MLSMGRPQRGMLKPISFYCWFLKALLEKGWINCKAFVLLSGICTFWIKAERLGTVKKEAELRPQKSLLPSLPQNLASHFLKKAEGRRMIKGLWACNIAIPLLGIYPGKTRRLVRIDSIVCGSKKLRTT